jgi:integrase
VPVWRRLPHQERRATPLAQRDRTGAFGPPCRPRDLTLEDHVDRYLAAHATGREASTIKTLTHRLGYATDTFGDLTLEQLERRVPEIAAWAGTLPSGSRYGIVQAFRQALEAAVRWGHMTSNPAKLAGPNRQPRAEEIHPFTQAEIDLVAEELGPKYGAAVVFASETGMRPSEWLAIEWRDVDRKAGVVLVERTCAYGVTKSYGKTTRSRRRVPLSTRAPQALDAVPRRLDVRLVFPGVRRGVIDLRNFRRAQWRRSRRPDYPRGGSTTCATRSRRGRSTPAYRSSTCPGTWARPSR